MGLFGGAFIAACLFFILWRLDGKVRVPSDLSFLGSGLQVLTLPSLEARRRSWPDSFVRLAAALQCGLRDLRAPAPPLALKAASKDEPKWVH
jgi:hypothetical protein